MNEIYNMDSVCEKIYYFEHRVLRLVQTTYSKYFNHKNVLCHLQSNRNGYYT